MCSLYVAFWKVRAKRNYWAIDMSSSTGKQLLFLLTAEAVAEARA